jgi:hypothetical protein
VPRSTVQLCLSRFAAAGLSWPLPATLSEQGLEALLFALPAGPREGNSVVGTHALSVGTYSSSNDSTPPNGAQHQRDEERSDQEAAAQPIGDGAERKGSLRCIVRIPPASPKCAGGCSLWANERSRRRYQTLGDWFEVGLSVGFCATQTGRSYKQ